MGICAWVRAKARKAKEWVCDKASQVRDKVTNLWNDFTGKRYYIEAEELYEKITERYNTRRRKFEDDEKEYIDKIEAHIDKINRSKRTIKTELFPEMARKMEKIKDISVSQNFVVEEYMAGVLSFDQLRTKDELYTINFDKDKLKTSLLAIFSFGFYTRKKAKETLIAVQEEEKKIDAEIAKMNAETVKLQLIEQALDNVELYFVILTELYGNLLVRLDSSVNYLYVNCMAFAHKLIHTEMSIKRLPKMQRKEVEAIVTASKILKAMVDTRIMAVEDQDKVEKYSQDMKKQYDEMNRTYQAA